MSNILLGKFYRTSTFTLWKLSTIYIVKTALYKFEIIYLYKEGTVCNKGYLDSVIKRYKNHILSLLSYLNMLYSGRYVDLLYSANYISKSV